MHDESLIVSRGSIARGLHIPFLEETSFQDVEGKGEEGP